MKKISNSVRAGLVAAGVLVATTSAQAAVTIPSVDMTNFENMATAVLVGLAVIWGVKKAIGLIRA